MLVLLGVSAPYLSAQIQVTDDVGRSVVLEQPAQRIISLAPHITEVLFSAGAGEQIVGVVSYSDYPPQAQTIPEVGSYDRLDLEQILALQPDLIVGWQSGNPDAGLEHLQRLSIPLYLSEPRNFSDIASNLQRLGRLANSSEVADPVAQLFLSQLETLQQRYRHAQPVSVFYQVWREPLMTFNGEHLFNRIIQVCGGRNLFAELPRIASAVELEAVLKADPEVILLGDVNRAWLEDWHRWSTLQAVRNDRLYALNQDVLIRPTTRVVDGIRAVCEVLQPQL